MKPWSVLIIIIAGLTIIASMIFLSHSNEHIESAAIATDTKNPVIVELFTSEGCSSCPPADKVLADLQKNQSISSAQIIALGEHVDYWDDLGWKDAFSSPAYSARQLEYAHSLGVDTYTPQMVIDGQTEFVGSNGDKARTAIINAARSKKAHLDISRSKTNLIKVTATEIPPITPGDTLEIILAITENNLSSDVTRGENAHQQLNHGTVVRQLSVIGKAPAAETNLSLDKNWKLDNLHLVAFLQEKKSRHILGATIVDVTEPHS